MYNFAVNAKFSDNCAACYGRKKCEWVMERSTYESIQRIADKG